MACTWNPSDKSSGFTLSNGDLTAAVSTSNQCVRATTGRSTGKYYFEIYCASGDGDKTVTFGVANSSWSLSSSYVGADTNGWGRARSKYGDSLYRKYHDGDQGDCGYGVRFDSGDTVCIAVDLNAGKIWWGKAGTWFDSGNPATGSNPAFTGITGTVYPAICSGGTTSSSSYTAKFASGSASYTVPSGFEMWGAPVALTETTTDTVVCSETSNTDTLTELADAVEASEVSGFGEVYEHGDTLVIVGALPASSEIVAAPIADGAVATETLGGAVATSTRDVAAATSVLAGALSISTAASDSIAASDAISAHVAGTSDDGAIASENLTSGLIAAIENAAGAADETTTYLGLSGASADTVISSEYLDAGSIQMAADEIGVFDELAGPVAVVSPMLSDGVAAGEVLLGHMAVYATTLADTLVEADSIGGVLAMVGVLGDSVLAGDVLEEAAYQLIVVTNVETGAVSTYTLTPTVAGLAEYRGTLYLAGPDGLYAMDATEDEDGAVAWVLRTGFTALGTDRFKRMQDANVLASTEGETTLQVVSDRLGVKQAWNYTLPPLTRTAYRDGVIKVGKGVQSVYYQFALAGTGPAEIDHLRATLIQLSRRH